MLELADSSVQRVLFAFITVLNDQAIKKHITPNKVEVKSNMCPYVSLRTYLLIFYDVSDRLHYVYYCNIIELKHYTVYNIFGIVSREKCSHEEIKLITLLLQTAYG